MASDKEVDVTYPDRSSSFVKSVLYRLDGQQLTVATCTFVVDLSVAIIIDLSWSTHIEETVAKADKRLGLIKRLCKDFKVPRIRKLLYCWLEMFSEGLQNS